MVSEVWHIHASHLLAIPNAHFLDHKLISLVQMGLGGCSRSWSLMHYCCSDLISVSIINVFVRSRSKAKAARNNIDSWREAKLLITSQCLRSSHWLAGKDEVVFVVGSVSVQVV